MDGECIQRLQHCSGQRFHCGVISCQLTVVKRFSAIDKRQVDKSEMEGRKTAVNRQSGWLSNHPKGFGVFDAAEEA